LLEIGERVHVVQLLHAIYHALGRQRLTDRFGDRLGLANASSLRQEAQFVRVDNQTLRTRRPIA
jgi:hypothetical protein